MSSYTLAAVVVLARLHADPCRRSCRRERFTTESSNRDPAFKCQMTIVLDGKPVETKYELLTDGREVVSTEGGRRIASSLRWDADALIATWRIESPNGCFETLCTGTDNASFSGQTGVCSAASSVRRRALSTRGQRRSRGGL
jgi:hypothetical protein